MTEEQKKEIESLFWWHRIPLEGSESGYVTPGICPHGHAGDFEARFGLPDWLQNERVLDIGGYDGLFSFECENRGAKRVLMIDIYQNSPNKERANRPFQLAKEVLNSCVEYRNESLESFNPGQYYNPDLILYLGVLYHIENPLGAVKKLMSIISRGGTILLETAISIPSLYSLNTPILEYRPNFDGDPNNHWYPNREWVKRAFMENGAKSVDIVYEDNSRATYRINA